MKKILMGSLGIVAVGVVGVMMGLTAFVGLGADSKVQATHGGPPFVKIEFPPPEAVYQQHEVAPIGFTSHDMVQTKVTFVPDLPPNPNGGLNTCCPGEYHIVFEGWDAEGNYYKVVHMFQVLEGQGDPCGITDPDVHEPSEEPPIDPLGP
jgi:hypothetical protein